MATYNATDLLTKPRHMGEFGNGVVYTGSVNPTAAGLGDVIRPVVIPGGVMVTDVDIVGDDLDTGTALAAKIGYVPLNAADGPTANDAYFSAAGAFMQSAGRKTCSFHPIKFENPVVLTITVTTAAGTFAAGKVSAIVKGDGLGRV
jgi:hypothetical protein